MLRRFLRLDFRERTKREAKKIPSLIFQPLFLSRSRYHAIESKKKFILLTLSVQPPYKKRPSKKAEHTTTNHTSFFLTPITVEEVLQQYGFHSSGFRFLTLVVPRRPNHDEVPEITRSKVVGCWVEIFRYFYNNLHYFLYHN